MFGFGCLIALAVVFAPRLALIVMWFVSPRVSAAFDTWIMPLLGIIFLPYTTIMYIMTYITPGVVVGWDWIWIGMGFSNNYLKGLEKHLKPGSSALIALIEHERLSSVEETAEYFGGEIFRQALTDDIVTKLTTESE